MKPFTFLVLLFFSLAHSVFSQNDSLKYNKKDPYEKKYYRLPPGPSTISGTLVDQDGNPIKGAKVTVKYPDGKQRSVDTFTSNEEGIFQVYIFREDQPYIDLEIKVGEKVCKTIRYNKPGKGINLGSAWQKIECKIPRRNKNKTSQKKISNK